MKRVFAIGALVLLYQCKPVDQKETENIQTDSVVTFAGSDSTGVNLAYQYVLDQLPDETASLRRGLELFKTQFQSPEQTLNDKSLKTYLEFHNTILEILNNRYMSRPDYDRINNLYNADSLQYTFEGKVLAQEFLENGLALGSGEGQSYLKIDPKLARSYFYDHLTPASKMFFDEFEKEENQIDSDDGGLIISVEDVAERLGVWDTYLTNYPNALFEDHAKGRVKYYLSILLSGLDNTPAFGYDDRKLTPEYQSAYQYYVAKFPNTISAKRLQDYLAILSKTGMIQSDESEKFAVGYGAY